MQPNLYVLISTDWMLTTVCDIVTRTYDSTYRTRIASSQSRALAISHIFEYLGVCGLIVFLSSLP